MTRGHARRVIARLVAETSRSVGHTGTGLLQTSVALCVRGAEADEPIRPEDLDVMRRAVKEANRIWGRTRDERLARCIRSVEREVALLGTGVTLMHDSDP